MPPSIDDWPRSSRCASSCLWSWASSSPRKRNRPNLTESSNQSQHSPRDETSGAGRRVHMTLGDVVPDVLLTTGPGERRPLSSWGPGPLVLIFLRHLG